MASSDTPPSQSLINAAIQSLASGGAVGDGVLAVAGFASGAGVAAIAGVAEGACVPAGAGAGVVAFSPLNIVQVYHSSLVPSVSVNGKSIPRHSLNGPLAVDKNCLAPEFDHDFTNI
jgi:hypothetical protein